MSTAYLLSLMLFHADMATGAGPRRALRPRRPRCCLWLLRRAASHPWTVCGHRLMDGPANRSRQGITRSPWSRGGRRADPICILSAMLKPGGGCNLNQLMILPLPLKLRYRYWLDSTVSFEVISIKGRQLMSLPKSLFGSVFSLLLKLINILAETLQLLGCFSTLYFYLN